MGNVKKKFERQDYENHFHEMKVLPTILYRFSVYFSIHIEPNLWWLLTGVNYKRQKIIEDLLEIIAHTYKCGLKTTICDNCLIKFCLE